MDRSTLFGELHSLRVHLDVERRNMRPGVSRDVLDGQIAALCEVVETLSPRGDGELSALAAETARADREAAARQEAERKLAKWEGNGGLLQAVRELNGWSDAWPDHGNVPLAIAASYALAVAERDRLRDELAVLRGHIPRTPGTGRQALIEQEK